jgi:hypothetical protein
VFGGEVHQLAVGHAACANEYHPISRVVGVDIGSQVITVD